MARLVDSARTVNMRYAGTIAAGDIVKLDTNGVSVAGDGETAWGIAISDGVAGDIKAIWRGSGTFEADAAAGVNFANGDRAYLAAAGEVDTGSATNVSCGVVVDNDPATAGKVIIDFDPWGTFAHA